MPINWAVRYGKQTTGVTLHHMVKWVNAGDIVNQKAVLIGQRDTALDVFRKIVPIARLVLENSLDSIKRGKVPRIAQDESKATCFGAWWLEDRESYWSRHPTDICNLVRSISYPYSGAFTKNF